MSFRIVHIITTIERGGAETQLLMLARKQSLEGNKVEVIYLKGLPSLLEDFKSANVEVNAILTGKPFLFQTIILKKHLRRMSGKFILHAHLPQAELLATFAKTSGSILINSRHYGGKFFPGANKYFSSLLGRLATLRSTFVIAISESVATLLIANREVRKSVPVKKIYYGLNPEIFIDQDLKNNPFNLKPGTNIGTVARLSPEKDLPTLLKAFKIVCEEQNDTNLYIVGNGKIENELRLLAYELGIGQKTKFLGKTSQVFHFMNSIDIFVLTSRYEGFGMVILEAMAANTRLIVADNSAQVEVLGKSGAGYLFETGNEVDLARQIVAIKKKSRESFKVAQENQLNFFSIDRAELSIRNLYEEALFMNSKPPPIEWTTP